MIETVAVTASASTDWDTVRAVSTAVAAVVGALVALVPVIASVYRRSRSRQPDTPTVDGHVLPTVYRSLAVPALPSSWSRWSSLGVYLALVLFGLFTMIVGVLNFALAQVQPQFHVAVGMVYSLGGFAVMTVYGVAAMNSLGPTTGRPLLRRDSARLQGSDGDVLRLCRRAMRDATSRLAVLDTLTYPDLTLLAGAKSALDMLGGPIFVGACLRRVSADAFQVTVVAVPLNTNTRADWGRTRLAMDRVLGTLVA